jgi:Fe-S-cluster containining protein
MLNFKEFPHGRWHSKPCSSLVEGLCEAYEDRPLACVGSPFFDGGPEEYPPNKFLVPWCCFRKLILDLHGIPYEFLPSGDECIIAYTEQGLGDFERWAARKFYKKQTIFWK